MPIGERVLEQYVKHPAAASGWLPDGAPLDAGTVHLVHSNLAHLSEQNTRLIAHLRGPGVVGYDDGRGAWPEIFDADQGTDEVGLIPWHRPQSAVCVGPIALSMTRLGTSPAGFYPRKIRVIVECEKGNTATTTLRILAVLTGGADTPLRAPQYKKTWATLDDVSPGAGQYVVDLELDCQLPVRPTQVWRCREDGTSEASSVAITPAWVWIGWDAFNASNTDRVWSISVFEVY